MTILRGKDIEVYFGSKLVLKDISFSVREGELVAIIGANGAGKTTLLRVLSGIIKPSKGDVLFFDKPIKNVDLKQLAYLPQKSNFDDQFPLRVFDMVQLGWGTKGIFGRNGQKEIKNVTWALEQVGLEDFEKRFFTELSGGQQQLVLLARTLYARPRLVFLDEPTTGLDPLARKRFYDLLVSLRERLGLTILIVSHDQEAVLEVASKLLVLAEGKLVYDGEPVELGLWDKASIPLSQGGD